MGIYAVLTLMGIYMLVRNRGRALENVTSIDGTTCLRAMIRRPCLALRNPVNDIHASSKLSLLYCISQQL